MKTTLLKLALVLTALLVVLDVVFIACTRTDVVNAKKSKMGSIVRLVNKGSTFCTGTVLTPHTILTAAHCIATEGLMGEATIRTDIEIRPSNNSPVGVKATVYDIRYQMDQALLRGDFQQFSTRSYISDVGELTILKKRAKLTACGYPLGGPFYCGAFFYKEPDNFFWRGSGVLIPGMSGGCVYDEDGNVVATNVAVTGPYSIVSPIYNLDMNIIP